MAPGGGHDIVNQAGSTLAKEDALQIIGASVSDDSTNGRTVIEMVKEVTQTQLDNLGNNEDGRYYVDDDDDAEIGPASDDYVEVTASNDTWGTLLGKLYALIDFDKLTLDAKIIVDTSIYHINMLDKVSKDVRFSSDTAYSSSALATLFLMHHGNFRFWCEIGNNVSPTTGNSSSTSVTDGTKITLYYGTKKAVVDLQTTANRCLMTDGKTVESEINGEIIDLGQYLNTTAFTNGHPDLFKAVRMGSMIVMNICGVQAKTDGSGQTMLTLPANFFSGYASATVFTDASGSSILMAGVFTNGSNLACHIPSGVAGKKLWGQIILRTGSYFD